MKRTSDLILALILILPVTLVIAGFCLVILALDRLYPLFKQERLGRDGVPFMAYKLQTMRPTDDPSLVGDKAADATRVTPLGLWLRNRGLDELPQIYSILLGQMSFTGPRPFRRRLVEEIPEKNRASAPQFERWAEERIRVRPGLSGWHQIHSPGAGVVGYDLEYLRDPSLGKELEIFGSSILILLVDKERYFSRR